MSVLPSAFRVCHFCRSVGQSGCRWNLWSLSIARSTTRVGDISGQRTRVQPSRFDTRHKFGFGAGNRSTQSANVKARLDWTANVTSKQQTSGFSDGVQFYWDSSFCWRKPILKTSKLCSGLFLVTRGWLYSKGAGKLKKEWLHLQPRRHLRQHLQQRQKVKRRLLCVRKKQAVQRHWVLCE